MQKTIGGDRIGSGSKMKFEMKNYERSTHDLGYIWRSSMSCGTLVPFMVEVALPGDTFDIDIQADVKTHPTLGPLFGSFKVQCDIYQAPVRLYHSALIQNTLNIGNAMQNVLLPVIQCTTIPQYLVPYPTDPNNTQINPSCLLAYLGIRGWGFNTGQALATRSFNGIPYFAYWDIYKQYYANKQETTGAYIVPGTVTAKTITSITVDGTTMPTPSGNGPNISPTSTIIVNFTGTPPILSQVLINTFNGVIPLDQIATFTFAASTATSNAGTVSGPWIGTSWSYATPNEQIVVATFPLTNIDDNRTAIIQTAPTARFTKQNTSSAPYGIPLAVGTGGSLGSQCGLGLKTYQSDLFNNWMNTTWNTTITTASNVSTAGGFFSMDTLLLSRKVYDLLNRIALSGGSYDDWLEAVYAHNPYTRCTSPMYEGGLSKELVFQEVISNSASTEQPLGTLAGRGIMTNKHKGGKITIKVDEPGYIIGIVSLTPRIDYSQGNMWYNNILTMDNFHKPGLDQIGFQDLITEQMAWWDTEIIASNVATTRSAGKQPAWINYQTNINRTYGNFAVLNNEMFMTLNRRYEFDTATKRIKDLTTYIDPANYNFIFAQTSLDAQNFWVQIGVDMIVRRKMSAKIMPNL
jgi:hypothetical protein